MVSSFRDCARRFYRGTWCPIFKEIVPRDLTGGHGVLLFKEILPKDLTFYLFYLFAYKGWQSTGIFDILYDFCLSFVFARFR